MKLASSCRGGGQGVALRTGKDRTGDGRVHVKSAGRLSGSWKGQNQETNAAFFNKLKENKNVVELPSGLRYEMVKPDLNKRPETARDGEGALHGTLIDGSVFDSSV